MRIEILVDNEDPRIYPLDRPKIVVGTHESCDIVIQRKGISRKHLVLTVKDDKFYVADQGSTNGSYINEHRLVPGSSAEFTTFFPVRLGDDVLMTLLSDEEVEDFGPESSFNTQRNEVPSEREESTRVISLNDLNKSSTSGLVQRRAETVTRRKSVKQASPPKKKTAASNTTMGVIALILVAGAAYYQFVLNRDNGVIETKIEKQPVAKVPVIDNRPVLRLDQGEIPTGEKILEAYKGAKCSTEIEKYICVKMPLIYQEKWGTVQIENSTVIVADGAKYFQAAQAYVKAPTENLDETVHRETLLAYQYDVSLMMTVLWVQENVPQELNDLSGMKNNSITLAFLDLSKEEGRFVTAVGFVPESILRLKKKIQNKHFADAKANGALEFSYALEYLRL